MILKIIFLITLFILLIYINCIKYLYFTWNFINIQYFNNLQTKVLMSTFYTFKKKFNLIFKLFDVSYYFLSWKPKFNRLFFIWLVQHCV